MVTPDRWWEWEEDEEEEKGIPGFDTSILAFAFVGLIAVYLAWRRRSS